MAFSQPSITAAGGAAIAPIRAAFGAGFIAADGALDRGRMRDASFSDPLARKKLEAIVHPRVHRRIELELAALQEAERDAGREDIVAVLDVPHAAALARRNAGPVGFVAGLN